MLDKDTTSYKVIGCAMEVHRTLGPGLLESVYEKALIHELKLKGFSVQSQLDVEVNYKGTLLDGTVFDSSYDRGETAKFPLDRVIAGWTEGLQLVGEGGKITLWIPYELGYGPRQMSAELPGYSTLIFDVELIKVNKAAEKNNK